MQAIKVSAADLHRRWWVDDNGGAYARDLSRLDAISRHPVHRCTALRDLCVMQRTSRLGALSRLGDLAMPLRDETGADIKTASLPAQT